MDSNDIACFETLYRRQSIAAAANELGTSRQTLTSAVARLEMELSVRLFVRSKRGSTPTPAGHAFHRQVERFSAQWRDAVDELRRIDRGMSRTLRLGCNIAYLTSSASSAITSFREEHPEIWVATRHFPDYDQLWASFAAADLDVALGGEPPDDLGATPAAVGSGATFLCMAPDHQLARLPSVAFPSGLAGQHVITCIAGGQKLLNRYGITAELSLPNLSAVADLVAGGRYVSLAPDQYLAEYLDRGCVCVPLSGFPGTLRSYLLVRDEDDAPSRELARLLRASLEREARWNLQRLGLTKADSSAR